MESGDVRLNCLRVQPSRAPVGKQDRSKLNSGRLEQFSQGTERDAQTLQSEVRRNIRPKESRQFFPMVSFVGIERQISQKRCGFSRAKSLSRNEALLSPEATEQREAPNVLQHSRSPRVGE